MSILKWSLKESALNSLLTITSKGMSFTSLSTGGVYKRSLNSTHIPAHSHLMGIYQTKDEASGYGLTNATPFQNRVLVVCTDNRQWQTSVTGQGLAFDISQPYIAVYFWRRTS